jgi:hypothetical protein
VNSFLVLCGVRALGEAAQSVVGFWDLEETIFDRLLARVERWQSSCSLGICC